MPSLIPPYKTPRVVSVEDTRKTRRKPATVIISETEEQKSDSEDETQFGVVWEKMTEEQTKMVQNANKTTETASTQSLSEGTFQGLTSRRFRCLREGLSRAHGVSWLYC